MTKIELLKVVKSQGKHIVALTQYYSESVSKITELENRMTEVEALLRNLEGDGK